MAGIVAVVAAYGQQSDPGSGVLVPEAPRWFHTDMQAMVRQSLPTAGAVPRLPGQAAVKTCAIPLLEVPVKDHLDDGIFQKGANAQQKGASAQVDKGIAIIPPALPCK